MSTLHLVAPGYRDAASAIPAFVYDAQPVSDIRTAVSAVYAERYGPSDAVSKEVITLPGWNGAPDVRALLYGPAPSEAPTPAILHIHGGAWIAGSPDMLASFCAEIARKHGVIVLSVDYRLAPETPFPGPLDDCYAALAWLHENAAELGVDPDRISVLGDSAGGNLAAGLALRARDEGRHSLRAQLLIYPALDNRTGGPDSPFDNPSAGEFVITRDYMRAVWNARTGATEPVGAALTYLAPARAADLSGLPPTYIVVGSLDLFVDEVADYAARLGRVGVPIELHVYDGVFHGFDLIPGDETDRFTAELDLAIDRLSVAGRETR